MPRKSRVDATIERLADQAAKREAVRQTRDSSGAAERETWDAKRKSKQEKAEKAAVESARNDVLALSPAALTELARKAIEEPVGVFAVDKLGLPWGRAALCDAIRAARQGVWQHALDLDRFDRDAELRLALRTAIESIKRARELANLLGELHAAGCAYEREATRILERPAPQPNGRGSRGRPVQEKVREAVDKRWGRETGRKVPRVVDKERHKSLIDLQEAISKDIFGAANAVGPLARRTAGKSAP